MTDEVGRIEFLVPREPLSFSPCSKLLLVTECEDVWLTDYVRLATLHETDPFEKPLPDDNELLYWRADKILGRPHSAQAGIPRVNLPKLRNLKCCTPGYVVVAGTTLPYPVLHPQSTAQTRCDGTCNALFPKDLLKPLVTSSCV
eukprot:7459247-Pyramimonas_sp.AAC.1